ERYSPNFINERENFYHKPQINLNWYSDLSENIDLTNVAYYSGGSGGGTGTWGDIVWDRSGPSQVADWDATIAANRANTDDSGQAQSLGILRNSRNNQWIIGDILKIDADVGDFHIGAGVDWRTAEID